MNICILTENTKKNFGAPLLPKDIEDIKNKNTDLNFYYESSTQRIISDKNYNSVGCKKYSNQKIDLFLSIRSIKKKSIKKGCAYLFFSHIIRQQPENIELLKKIINSKGSLIDYELTKNSRGKELFLDKEDTANTFEESTLISKRLSSILPKIVRNLNEDKIEENFIVKKGYLNHLYMNLIDYLI